jgi:hypothetical protein
MIYYDKLNIDYHYVTDFTWFLNTKGKIPPFKK